MRNRRCVVVLAGFGLALMAALAAAGCRTFRTADGSMPFRRLVPDLIARWVVPGPYEGDAYWSVNEPRSRTTVRTGAARLEEFLRNELWIAAGFPVPGVRAFMVAKDVVASSGGEPGVERRRVRGGVGGTGRGHGR